VALSQDPAVSAIVTRYGRQVTAASFAASFRASLASMIGILAVVLALTFGLPRPIRIAERATADADGGSGPEM
jgi:hypothetical protein